MWISLLGLFALVDGAAISTTASTSTSKAAVLRPAFVVVGKNTDVLSTSNVPSPTTTTTTTISTTSLSSTTSTTSKSISSAVPSSTVVISASSDTTVPSPVNAGVRPALIIPVSSTTTSAAQALRPGLVVVGKTTKTTIPPSTVGTSTKVTSSSQSSSTLASTTAKNSVSTKSLSTSTSTSILPTTTTSTIRTSTTKTTTSSIPKTTSTTVVSSTSKPSTTSSSSKTSTTSSTSKTTTTTSLPKTSTTTTSKTTTSTSASATVTANLNGCWVDYYPSYRVMNGSSTSSSSMTPQVCAKYCSNAGFEISGTQYADECYCSHSYPTTWSTGCNMRCAGDSTQFCGGSNALNVVYTAVTTTATTSTKRGLCWPWNNANSIFSLFDPSKETWVYNWEMWSPLSGTVYAAAQYVGMVRDPTRLEQISWYYTSTSQVSPYLLGFNEPDLPGDTLVSVADAVTYWKQYFLPLRKSYGTILGAPAVTNAVATNWGIDWLNQFNAACQDTTTTPGTSKSCFDFIPLHWYGYSVSDFENYVSNFHSVYPSYPLWITEFAFQGHDAASVAILERQALAWLDSQSYVARYSMFGPMNAANMAGIDTGAMLTDDQTALTTVGKIYAGQI